MSLARKEIIARNFGRCADTYERVAEIQRDTAETLASLLPELTAPSILEIGCGTGFLTQQIVQKYKDGTFLITDISAEMVDFTKHKIPETENIDFKVMDGEFPESDQKFDLIVTSMTVQWFDDPIEGLNQLKTFLKPGGKLFFTSLGENSFKEWRKTLKVLDLPEGVNTGIKLPGTIQDEERKIFYPSTMAFLRSVKAIGAHEPKEGYSVLRPVLLRRACALHDKVHDSRHSWHIVYGCLEN